MSMTPVILEVRDLDVSLPLRAGRLRAVRGISFDVKRGETVCIVGESGCGKSMSAMAILNLLPNGAERRAASLSLLGEDLLKADDKRLRHIRGNKIGMIFQEPLTALNPSLTIGEQLMEVYRRHRPDRKSEAHGRAVEMLGQVGIPSPAERMEQYPHHLSGGLRQRVIIAMAMMCEPDLIIADEPTTALDVTVQAQILRLLHDLKERFGLALLLITHDLAIASRVADHIVVMYGGQVVEQAPTVEFFSRPLHPYSEGLLACLPNGDPEQHGQPLQVIPGTVPSLIGELKGCTFLPRCGQAGSECSAAIDLRGDGTHKVRCVHARLPEVTE